jgi:hypothetical protein
MIDGLTTTVGARLAARIVRGSSAGLTAGRAAVVAGHNAAQAGGPLAVSIAEMALDGALGGAAGELFHTAIDEATWDRGVTSMIARMLAALARGATLGAVAGGGIGLLGAGLGRIAAHAGSEVAKGLGLGRLLDSSTIGRNTFETFSEPCNVSSVG